MANVLQTGSAWLGGVLNTSAGTPITYRRGSSSIPMTSTKGTTKVEVQSADGSVIPAQIDDYLIDVAALKINNVLIEPRAGDQIVEADGLVHEVMDYGGAVGAWEWWDNFATKYRVHTKQVAA